MRTKFYAVRTDSDGSAKVVQYPCRVCKAVFYSQDDLTVHIQTHKEDGLYACHLCRKTFPNQVFLANHKVICEKRHASQMLLNHQQQALQFLDSDLTDVNDDNNQDANDSEDDALGDYGMEEILEKMDADREREKNREGRIHMCLYCNTGFEKKALLIAHLKTHGAKKNSKAVFYSQGDLTQHVQMHKEDGSYACDRCKMTFSNQVFLANHKVICEKEKPHTVTKPEKEGRIHKCLFCDKGFEKKNLLVVHLKTVHEVQGDEELSGKEFITLSSDGSDVDDALDDCGLAADFSDDNSNGRNIDSGNIDNHWKDIPSVGATATVLNAANVTPSSKKPTTLKFIKVRKKKQNKTCTLLKHQATLKVLSEDFLTCHKENVESLENFGKHVKNVMEKQLNTLDGLSFAEEVVIKSAAANLENLTEYLTEELCKQTASLEKLKDCMKDKLENIVTNLKDLLSVKKKEESKQTIVVYPVTALVDNMVLTDNDSVHSNLDIEEESTDLSSFIFEEMNTSDVQELDLPLLNEEAGMSGLDKEIVISTSRVKKTKEELKKLLRERAKAKRESTDLSSLIFEEMNTSDVQELDLPLFNEEAAVSRLDKEIVVSSTSMKITEEEAKKLRREQDRLKREAEKKEGPYGCDICGQVYTLKSSLSRHKKVHSGNRSSVVCPVCGKVLSRDLRNHMLVHTGERPHQCDICGKRFGQAGHLTTHVASHNTGKPHQCEICGKAYKVRQYLMDHMRCHDGKLRHVCQVCGKRFVIKTVYERHMMTHNGFKCKICNIPFDRGAKLDEHNCQVHGKRRYVCDTCGKGFTLKAVFLRHMMTHNGFKCEICDIEFDGGGEFDTHNYQVHGKKSSKYYTNSSLKKRVVCEICGKEMSKLSLKNHMILHKGERPFKCSVCQRTFTQVAHLNSHLLTHTGERPHKCSICGSAFALKGNLNNHMRTHTGEHPFVCKICDRPFKYSNNLKKHVLAVHQQMNEENSNAAPIASFDDEHNHEGYTDSLPNQEHAASNLYREDNIALVTPRRLIPCSGDTEVIMLPDVFENL